MKRLGLLTIGEAPREDLVEDWSMYFERDVMPVQKGILDKLAPHQIKRLAPKANDTVLITKTADGKQRKLGKEQLLPKIQMKIAEFAQEDIHLIVLACTGSFPLFNSSIPLIYPDYLVGHVLKGVFKNKIKLHVIVPSPLQFESITQKWNSFGFEVTVSACSPYTTNLDEFSKLGGILKSDSSDVILLDCMGYSEEMKRWIQVASAKPVLLSRSLLYKNVAEML